MSESKNFVCPDVDRCEDCEFKLECPLYNFPESSEEFKKNQSIIWHSLKELIKGRIKLLRELKDDILVIFLPEEKAEELSEKLGEQVNELWIERSGQDFFFVLFFLFYLLELNLKFSCFYICISFCSFNFYF